MNKKRSMDGFVTRGASTTSGQERKLSNAASARPSLHTGSEKHVSNISDAPTETTLGRTNIREALESLDDEPSQPKLSRRQKRRLRHEGGHRQSKKRIKLQYLA